MKIFWRYIFPVLFGMLIYTSIRLVNDVTAGVKFWERPWKTNAIEIAGVVLTSFIIQWGINRLIRYYKSRETADISAGKMLREFGVAILVTLLIIHVTIIPMVAFTDDGLQWNDYVIVNIIPALYVLLYFVIIRSNQYLKNYVAQKVQLEKITNDQLQTELKFLKAQYHPHFLFNALNTIYFQMDENKEEAKKTVEMFSELLRYQLYDQQQTVPVSQEIHYLQNFIDIQKIRGSEKLQLVTNFDKSLGQQQVYPLLFLPLVENAFKYVGGDYKIEINAAAIKGQVEFMVTNSLPQQAAPEKKTGIGLENLKRRLALLYQGKHELIIKKENNNFIASVKLPVSQ